jgi:hypothetical protein
MPKIGTYDYPNIDLDEAIGYLKILKDKFAGDSKRETFSQEIGKKGGWFNMIVGSMNGYCLIETDRGRIRIGNLGKKILHGLTDAEVNDAKMEAVNKYRLFRELTERYPNGATLEQFQIFLRDVGNVDLEIVKTESSKTYKVYSAISKYLKPVAITSSQPETIKVGAEATGVKKDMEAMVKCPQGVYAVVTTSDNQTINITDADTYSELFSLIGKMFQKKIVKQEPQSQGGQ